MTLIKARNTLLTTNYHEISYQITALVSSGSALASTGALLHLVMEHVFQQKVYMPGPLPKPTWTHFGVFSLIAFASERERKRMLKRNLEQKVNQYTSIAATWNEKEIPKLPKEIEDLFLQLRSLQKFDAEVVKEFYTSKLEVANKKIEIISFYEYEIWQKFETLKNESQKKAYLKKVNSEIISKTKFAVIAAIIKKFSYVIEGIGMIFTARLFFSQMSSLTHLAINKLTRSPSIKNEEVTGRTLTFNIFINAYLAWVLGRYIFEKIDEFAQLSKSNNIGNQSPFILNPKSTLRENNVKVNKRKISRA